MRASLRNAARMESRRRLIKAAERVIPQGDRLSALLLRHTGLCTRRIKGSSERSGSGESRLTSQAFVGCADWRERQEMPAEDGNHQKLECGEKLDGIIQ